jgi:hypothetical protein
LAPDCNDHCNLDPLGNRNQGAFSFRFAHPQVSKHEGEGISEIRLLSAFSRAGVLPAIDRLTLAGETPALLSKDQQRDAVDINARRKSGSAFP